MEWNIHLNWPAIVEEAKQRRKAQKLTQHRLAALAGVSTPTISHFENGENDMQLSSVIAILEVLGMIDHRQLLFSEPNARYDSGREVVRFLGTDREKKIQCFISKEALEDHFKGNFKDPLKLFIANRERIEHGARRNYLAGQLNPDGSVLIRTGDL